MDNNFIVNLRAPSKCGKTTALKQLELLLTGSQSSEYDIKNVFFYRDVKIGISSRGDFGEWVNEDLNYFIEQRCDIIVCASRTKGAGSGAVYAACKNAEYTLITVGPVYSYHQNQIDLCKHNQAISLKELVDSLIDNQ